MFARNQSQSQGTVLSTSPPSWAGAFQPQSSGSAHDSSNGDEHAADDEAGPPSMPSTAGLGGRASSSNNSASASAPRALSQTSEDTQDYQLEGASPIDVHPTFSPHAAFPGTVKIVVEATTFWCALPCRARALAG